MPLNTTTPAACVPRTLPAVVSTTAPPAVTSTSGAPGPGSPARHRLDLFGRLLGVERFDVVAILGDDVPALQFHERGQLIRVGQPRAAEYREPFDLLDPWQPVVRLGHDALGLSPNCRVCGQLLEATELDAVLLSPRRGGHGIQHEQGGDELARLAEGDGLAEDRIRPQERLDVRRRDVLAVGVDDELFFAVDEAQVPVLVELADVARVQPALVVDRLFGLLRVLEVANHDRAAASENLAVLCDLDLDP